ncbi:hypothetical protein E4U32_000616 [Claviceps aff. humidiphila group G2b]|nr:hypothetical protein E4U32_000616 [Claviceps aff. humidiphila group G2b]
MSRGEISHQTFRIRQWTQMKDHKASRHEFITLRYEHVTLSRNNYYVRKVLAVNPMLMATTTLRLGMATCDPTPAPYSGATFNIHKDPEKLFRMFCGYLMINDDELGLDTFTKRQDGTLVFTMPLNIHATELTNLELEPGSIVCQRAIVCRATFCFLAKPIGDPDMTELSNSPGHLACGNSKPLNRHIV